MKEPQKLFKNIRKARVSSGLSQKELAKKLDVSNKTVSAYERGRAIPPAPTLAKIASITKTSVSNILGIEDDGNNIEKRLENIEKQLQETVKNTRARIKVDAFVGVVLLDDKDRIYLIKEKDKHGISKGSWNLPGGSVDGEETLLESAEREVKEETGYDAEIQSMVGCYKCKKGEESWIYTVFKAKTSGTKNGKTDPGVEEGKWFEKEEFMNLKKSQMVHTDMKLVYEIATSNKGLATRSIKFIDYDKE